MGAYYEACVRDERYCTHELNNGLKLMEHGYIGNNYCQAIEYKLLNNPQPLVWVCDYHEEDDRCSITWENTEEGTLEEAPNAYIKNKIVYVLNHSKGLYFELSKVQELLGESEYGLYIHPLPILCNSDITAMGGGDFHPEDIRRGTWCLDDISVSTDYIPLLDEFEDVTKDVLFKEI